MASRRKPGLWHGPRKVEVVEVKKAHRTPCGVCSCLPQDRRLEVTEGAGRHAKKHIFCIEHGVEWINIVQEQAQAAVEHLVTGEGSIRG